MPDTTPIPDGHFVDHGYAVPLVVRHETGEPVSAIVDGELVPFTIWKASQPPPPKGAPRTMTIQSGDGSFAGTIEVS